MPSWPSRTPFRPAKTVAVELQFSRQADPISSLIALESASPFSHVDAVIPPGCTWAEPGHLLGARNDKSGGMPKGVWVRPPNYHKWAAKVRFHVPATAAQEGAFYDYLHKQIGKPYDTSAIWGFAAGRNWRKDGSWYCSELITGAGEMATILPWLYIAMNKVNPGTCAAIYSAIGAVVL